MPELIITRGLPASGKSTYARVWVDEDRANRAQVERDHLRSMIDGGVFVEGVTEGRIVAARDAVIAGLLGRGVSVICSDTNLPQGTARDLAKIARRARAEIRVEDFTDVPLETCIERDAARADKKPVGETVIRDMHARYLAGRNLPLPLPAEDGSQEPGDLYEPLPGRPRAVIADIDGTLALRGTRSPFDETRVHEDRPNHRVAEAIRMEATAGNHVIFMSGRTAACRDATLAWIRLHVGVPVEALMMRPVGDTRKDSVVKREMFDANVRRFYNVRRVYDDRNQVVRMWRDLGLTVMQVADGDF